MNESSFLAPRLFICGAPVCRSGRPDYPVGAPQLFYWGAPIQLLGRRDIQLPPANKRKFC